MMKNLLEEIKSQPAHIREIFMWTCVIIVFSVVGFVWFRQTTRQFVALLHPEEAQERALAEAEQTLRQAQGKQLSPFTMIFDSFNGLRANISEILAGPQQDPYLNNGATNSVEKQVPPQRLPISE